jgi:hypothetical protein
MFHVKHREGVAVDQRLKQAGMYGVLRDGSVLGWGGLRWPGIAWPPENPDVREHGWMHLQNAARAEAVTKSLWDNVVAVRVKVYAYRTAEQGGRWEYTIGDAQCREGAFRPGVYPVPE